MRKQRPGRKQTGRKRAEGRPWLDSASLCSLAVALWGWQTGWWFVAIPMILAFEARHFVQQRWALSVSDLKEAGKLSSAILLLLFIVLIFTDKAFFIYGVLQWLPVAGIPLAMAQTYGLGVSSLLDDWFTNPHLQHRGIQPPARHWNLHYLFLGMCIAAASAVDTEGYFFYGAAVALVALALWPVRSRRLRSKRIAPILWLLLFFLSTGIGFVGHRQLTHLQGQLESRVIAMIGDMASGGAVNPDGTATQMGALGRLKLSNRILFRIKVENDDENVPALPLLLQEASYNRYQLATWSANNGIFAPVPPGEDIGEWILGAESGQTVDLTISSDVGRGEGILALPRGVARISQLPAEEMQRNQYGAVQVDTKGTTDYRVRYSLQPVRTAEAPPTAEDLQIPKADETAIEMTLAELQIADGESERAIAQKIAVYLQDFDYSLDLLRPVDNNTPVSDFLLNTKAGHCEYFASTTVLLLRAAGIPARYAVGFSAHEFSPLENQYIVRSRDAHAWTLAYIDGVWQVLDTTPPDWTAQDQTLAGPMQGVSDFVSFLSFQFSYRIRQLGELGLREILFVVIPLFAYLFWRSAQAFQGQRKRAEADGSESQLTFVPQGLDSELYDIERMLGERGLVRRPDESFFEWCDRLRPDLSSTQYQTLQQILTVHYRYRFDPLSLSSQERNQLRVLVESWLINEVLIDSPTV